jgi:hypothetical protein
VLIDSSSPYFSPKHGLGRLSADTDEELRCNHTRVRRSSGLQGQFQVPRCGSIHGSTICKVGCSLSFVHFYLAFCAKPYSSVEALRTLDTTSVMATASQKWITDPALIAKYNRGPITSAFIPPTSCTETLSLYGGTDDLSSVLYFGFYGKRYRDPSCYPFGTLSASDIYSTSSWTRYYCKIPLLIDKVPATAHHFCCR